MTAFYGATELGLPDDLGVDEWVDLLRSLGAIARGHQWWVGDALVFGEEHFGDEQAFAHADELGLEPHTQTNYRWVASAVAPSRRRDDLSWSHHAEVARLEPRQQRSALAWAAKNGAGVRELREYVAIHWPSGDASRPPADATAGDPDELQRRAGRVRDALDRLYEFDPQIGSDVAYLLDALEGR